MTRMTLLNLYINKKRKIHIYSFILYFLGCFCYQFILCTNNSCNFKLFYLFVVVLILGMILSEIILFYVSFTSKADKMLFLNNLFPLPGNFLPFEKNIFIPSVEAIFYATSLFFILFHIVASKSYMSFPNIRFYHYIFIHVAVMMNVYAVVTVYFHIVYWLIGRRK